MGLGSYVKRAKKKIKKRWDRDREFFSKSGQKKARRSLGLTSSSFMSDTSSTGKYRKKAAREMMTTQGRGAGTVSYKTKVYD